MDRDKAVSLARQYVHFASAMTPHQIYRTLHRLTCRTRKEFNDTDKCKDLSADDSVVAMLVMAKWAVVKQSAFCKKVLDHATVYLVHPSAELVGGAYTSDYVYDAFVEVNGVGFDEYWFSPTSPLTGRMLMELDMDTHICANYQAKVPLLRSIYIVDRGIPKAGCIQMVDIAKPYVRRYVEEHQKKRGYFKEMLLYFSATIGTAPMHVQTINRTIMIQELMDITTPRDRYFEAKFINIVYSIACAYLKFVGFSVPLMDSMIGKEKLISFNDDGTPISNKPKEDEDNE